MHYWRNCPGRHKLIECQTSAESCEQVRDDVAAEVGRRLLKMDLEGQRRQFVTFACSVQFSSVQ